MRLHSGQQRVYRGASPESNALDDEAPAPSGLHPARLLDGSPESAASDPSLLQVPVMPPSASGLCCRDVDLDDQKLSVNPLIAKTRRKKGDTCPRIEIGPPKTDKSRRTLDFPPFVAALLTEHRSEVHELRRSSGDRLTGWPAARKGTVRRRFQVIRESIGPPRPRLYGLGHTHASLLAGVYCQSALQALPGAAN